MVVKAQGFHEAMGSGRPHSRKWHRGGRDRHRKPRTGGEPEPGAPGRRGAGPDPERSPRGKESGVLPVVRFHRSPLGHRGRGHGAAGRGGSGRGAAGAALPRGSPGLVVRDGRVGFGGIWAPMGAPGGAEGCCAHGWELCGEMGLCGHRGALWGAGGCLGYSWVFWAWLGAMGLRVMLWVPVGGSAGASLPKTLRDAAQSIPHHPAAGGSAVWVTRALTTSLGTGDSWEDPGPVGVPGRWLGSGFTQHRPGAEVCSGAGGEQRSRGPHPSLGSRERPRGKAALSASRDLSKSGPALGSVPKKPLGSTRGFIPTLGEPGGGPGSRRAPQGEVLGWMWPGHAGCC